MGSVRPTAWRPATQWRGAWGLQWGAVRRLLAKWKKNSRALWVDLLLLTTGEFQAEVQPPLQGAPVFVAGGLTVRDEAAPISQHTHDPPAGGVCDRPLLLSTFGRRNATWREATSSRECSRQCHPDPPSNVSRLGSHQVEGICWDRPQEDLCPGYDTNYLTWL